MKTWYGIIGLFVVLVSLSLPAGSSSRPQSSPEPGSMKCSTIHLSDSMDGSALNGVMQAHARAALDQNLRIQSCLATYDMETGLIRCVNMGCATPCVQSGASCFCAVPRVGPTKEN